MKYPLSRAIKMIKTKTHLFDHVDHLDRLASSLNGQALILSYLKRYLTSTVKL
jgi:hypothetical protein